MNIVQFHERVRFWIDVVGSTRFVSQDIDNALNIVIDNKLLETYGVGHFLNRDDGLQRTQRCREILGPIVEHADKNTSGFTFSSNQISIAQSVGYYILLSLGALIGTKVYECRPLHYSRKIGTSENPFRKPRMTPSVRMYYNELDGKIVITHAYSGSLTDFELYFLKKPNMVNYGLEYNSTHSFNNNDVVIAVEETVYNGTTYKIGDEIIIVNPFLTITSGLVVFSYTNCNLPLLTHEEISRRAAVNCLMTSGQGDKSKLLLSEIITS